LIKDDEMKRSYLRGAFLAGGSVNNPETSSYHLEIFSQYEDHSEGLTKLMNSYELNAKHLERKKGSIAYLKEAEKISDFLSFCCANSFIKICCFTINKTINRITHITDNSYIFKL
jgi:DNA-binding protein WhiA